MCKRAQMVLRWALLVLVFPAAMFGFCYLRGVSLYERLIIGVQNGTADYEALQTLQTSPWRRLYALAAPHDDVRLLEALLMFETNMRGSMEIARMFLGDTSLRSVRVRSMIIFGEGAFRRGALDDALKAYEACLRLDGHEILCKAGIERVYRVVLLQSDHGKENGMSETRFQMQNSLEELLRGDGESLEGGAGRNKGGGSPL